MKKNQKLKDSQYGKDGEIKHLRTKLAQVESERFKDRQEKMQIIQQQSKEQSDKERRLEREMEKSKTDLQFMEREIDELKDRCRRQEKQLRSADGSSPVRATFQSPSKSQRVAPSSPRTPVRAGTGGFPTKGTFMMEETSPKKGVGKRTIKSEVDKATQISTPETLTAPERPLPPRKLRLGVTHSKGRITGPHLVDKLVENLNPQSDTAGAPGGGSSTFKQGVFSLLQRPLTVMDVSAVKVERDVLTMTFKPTAAPRTYTEAESAEYEVQEIDNQHHVALAQQAISHLLKQYGSESQLPAIAPISINLDSCNTTQAVLILPLLETIFDNYIDTMLSVNNTVTTSSGDSTAPSHSSIESSMSSLTAGVQSLALQGASYLNGVEERTICALKVLLKLVSYSAHVRLVLFCDKHYNCPSLADQLEPTQRTSEEPMESDNQQDKLSNELSQLDNTARHVAGNCDILNKVISLANPVEFNNSLGNVSVTEGAMHVLSVLAESMPASYFNRLTPLFTQESLLNCLNGEHFLDQSGVVKSTHVMVTLITSAVQLLTSLIQASSQYLQYLCSLDEDCLLLCMYQCCLDSIESLDPLQRQSICRQVYGCVSTLMSRHRRGSLLFFDRRCQCSSELVKCMVVTIRRELLLYQQTTSPITTTHHSNPTAPSQAAVPKDRSLLTFIHQGLVLFHALTMRDLLFTSHHENECKHEFVELLCNVHRVVSDMPESEQKQMLLGLMPDLWDVDMDYPESSDDVVDPRLFSGKDLERTSTPEASTSERR